MLDGYQIDHPKFGGPHVLCETNRIVKTGRSGSAGTRKDVWRFVQIEPEKYEVSTRKRNWDWTRQSQRCQKKKMQHDQPTSSGNQPKIEIDQQELSSVFRVHESYTLIIQLRVRLPTHCVHRPMPKVATETHVKKRPASNSAKLLSLTYDYHYILLHINICK